MTEASKPLKVGWKVSSLSIGMASLRYRAILPLLALAHEGVESTIFRTGLEEHLDGLDVLVIVKSLSAEDIFLAQQAAQRGVRVVFDLCDNIFIGEYGADKKGAVNLVQVFTVIASFADCIVTTTQPLADCVRQAVPGVRVDLIPDGIENADLAEQGARLLQQAAKLERSQRLRLLRHKAGNVLRRLREEGPRLMLPLARFVLFRGTRKLLRMLRGRLARLRKMATTSAPGPQADAGKAKQRIVWFGNHGAPHARFGMLDLLDMREALETVAREYDVELVVISNNRQKYEDHIRPLAIASRYVEWSLKAVDCWLKGAAVVVVPNSLDPFSICKSANRTVLAVEHGVPVVATPTPALWALADHIHTGDPLEGLRHYLANPQAGKDAAAEAYGQARQAFGQPAIAGLWRVLLDDLLLHPRRQAVDDPHTVVALHLVQDLDLASPILEAAMQRGLKVQAWCSASLIRKSPRVLAALRAKAIPFRLVHDEAGEAAQFPPGARALLTVAETNLGPHRFTRALSARALAGGLFVGTLQHGFENVGLTYSDTVHPIDKITFLAQRIYTWGPASTMHPGIAADVKARCEPVGCPKQAFAEEADLSGVIDAEMPVIGVFENLHWHRYDDAYRKAFLMGVASLAAAFPHVCFLVKPHHAGLWLTTRYEGDSPQAPNLVIADPQAAAWENHTASALLGRMSAVITTPSTVALDAARRGMPVAVFQGNLELLNYAPLPLIGTERDWAVFVRDALDEQGRPALEQASAAFVARVLVPGDAAQRIAGDFAAIPHH